MLRLCIFAALNKDGNERSVCTAVTVIKKGETMGMTGLMRDDDQEFLSEFRISERPSALGQLPVLETLGRTSEEILLELRALADTVLLRALTPSVIANGLSCEQIERILKDYDKLRVHKENFGWPK